MLKRNKGSRVAKIDRQRAPYPLPRPGKIKTVHPRPSPVSRKRRYSGRSVRALQPANASEETDMAQADEMGEGEGRDDGFIDGGGQEPFRRRSKKRAGESSGLSIYHDLILIEGVGLVLLLYNNMKAPGCQTLCRNAT